MTVDAEPADRPYHHGSLRASLVEAGLQLARADGPSGVGLRAATRLAGVSHNAAYRHFDRHDDLLAAVGQRCMQELAQRMQVRQASVRSRDPILRAWRRLDVIGETYVDFAVQETGWFRTAFTGLGTPRTEAHGAPERPGPYQLLGACLDELVQVGAVESRRRPGLEYAAWSAVHGLSTLLVDGPLHGIPDAERARVLRVVLDGVSRGLATGQAPGYVR